MPVSGSEKGREELRQAKGGQGEEGGKKLTDDSVVQYVHNPFSAFSRDAVKID